MIVHFKNKYDIHPIYKKKRHHTTSLSCCDPGGIKTFVYHLVKHMHNHIFPLLLILTIFAFTTFT